LRIDPYDGRKRVYHCGNDYLIHQEPRFDPTLIMVIDAQEATLGSTDGSHINTLWHERSGVMRKHDAGGQSQRRFERGRREALKQWLRSAVRVTRSFDKGQEVVIGGPGMTKDLFIKELPVELQDRIVSIQSTGYTDENGLWEAIGKSRYA